MNYKFSKKQRFYIPCKRLIDILLSLILILFLSPFMFVIAIIVTIDTKAFPIFRQRRIGKNKKEFMIFKFRSMNKSTPKNVPTRLLINSNEYISKFGRFIRRFSIDELPQLFNIFIGQMSFIGPRPALWNEEKLINGRDEVGVYKIKPGLSGLAQINGRDILSDDEKIIFDLDYLNKMSFSLDLSIFFKSIGKAIVGDDIVEGKQ